MPQLNLLLRRPSFLSFPGTLPGINWLHPAVAEIYLFSAVASVGSNPTFLSLNPTATSNVITATVTGTAYTSKIDPIIGPTCALPVGNSSIQFTSSGGANSRSTIFAAIFTYQTGGPSFQGVVEGGNGGFGLYILSGTPNIYFGASTSFGLPTLSNGVYFCAACIPSTAANTIANAVLTNLQTGQIFPGTSVTSTNATALGTISINNDTFTEPLKGATAAVMISQGTYLSLPQLIQWAQDPWSFWYPQKIDLVDLLSIIPVVAAGPSAAPLLQTRSMPGLGPRSRHTALLNAALPSQVVVPTVTAGTLPLMGVG